jgi:hypothetical protein
MEGGLEELGGVTTKASQPGLRARAAAVEGR